MKTLEYIYLFGVPVTVATEESILEFIAKRLTEYKCKLFIITPNPEIIVYAQRHPHYKSILRSADVALPDGVGVVTASRLLQLNISKRITGADFVESLCEKLSKKNVSVGFLGGRHGVAEKTADCLKKKYSGLKVTYVAEEFHEADFKKVPADVLFVAFGAPRQEEWIAQHIDQLPLKVAMGVGGTFDYISGKVGRAPGWVQKIGFEWLYRLIRQPWRLKRQLALIEFIWMVLKARVHSSR